MVTEERAKFHDRRDAGRELAHALMQYKGAKNTIVLALPRGGVVIGYEVSLALRVPLDVLVVRKLGIHNGSVQVESEVDVGTQFTLRLPVTSLPEPKSILSTSAG